MENVKIYIGNQVVSDKDWMESLKKAIKSTNIQLVDQDIKLKRKSDFVLYVFSPIDNKIRTIVDVVNDSNHIKEKTIFCSLDLPGEDGFSKHQKKSIVATGKMIDLNGGKWLESIEGVVKYVTNRNSIAN